MEVPNRRCILVTRLRASSSWVQVTTDDIQFDRAAARATLQNHSTQDGCYMKSVEKPVATSAAPQAKRRFDGNLCTERPPHLYRPLTAFIAALRAKGEGGKRLESSRRAAASAAVTSRLRMGINGDSLSEDLRLSLTTPNRGNVRLNVGPSRVSVASVSPKRTTAVDQAGRTVAIPATFEITGLRAFSVLVSNTCLGLFISRRYARNEPRLSSTAH